MAALTALFALAATASIDTAEPFRVMPGSEGAKIEAGAEFEFTITVTVPEGYYLYADETDVDFASLEGLIVTDVVYPQPATRHDPFLNKEVRVYGSDLRIRIKGEVPRSLEPGERELTAVVGFRGCSPTLCFRQEEREIAFSVLVLPAPAAAERPAEARKAPQEAGPPVSISERLGLRQLLAVRDFSVLLDRGLLFTVLVVFLAGLFTSLTPCVWPVLPAVFLFVGVHPHRRFSHNLLTAALLVAGLVLTYAGLGLGAVAFGRNLGYLYQQRWFLALVVMFFLAMSLSMLGAFDVRMPQRLQERIHRLGGRGYRGAFLAGIGLGLVASPCSGPVLAALLGYVALQGSYLKGFMLLIVFGAGMGLIMTLAGSFYGELAGRLRGGPWMVWIKRALGIMLLFPAAFYMGSLLGWSAGGFAPAQRPGIQWMSDEAQALGEARRTGKPVMIEFTADWCPPCRALERKFFSRAEIVELSEKMVSMRVDATSETPEVRRLIEKYGVMGWPSIVFLSPAGKPYDDLKVCDYSPTCVEEAMREAIDR